MRARANTRWMWTLLACALAFGSGPALGQSGPAVGDRPDCVIADGSVRADGTGYRHSVHIANHCDFAVDCRLFTDANPQVQNVHLASNASTDVMTYLSSQSYTFVAHVDCPHSPASRLPTHEE